MKKIYDCFTFYNELDLLELRLRELYNIVDHFVIVESNQTFTNKLKPFIFKENQNRFLQWMDKIIHIQVEDMPGSVNPWDNEFFQRDAILRGLADSAADDIVIVSDVDEIVRADAVKYIKQSSNSIFALRMTLHNFKFNYIKINPDRYNVWAMAGQRRYFDEITPNKFRDMRWQFMNVPYQWSNDGCEVIEHGGWHFGYMGDRNWLIDKAQSFSHQEANTPEFLAQIDPNASIAKRTSWKQDSADIHEIVKLDNYFPKELYTNPEKYQQWILPSSDITTFDLLPAYTYNT